jgi:hypothetical protein
MGNCRYQLFDDRTKGTACSNERLELGVTVGVVCSDERGIGSIRSTATATAATAASRCCGATLETELALDSSETGGELR